MNSAATTILNSEEWLIDSGSSDHVLKDINQATEILPYRPGEVPYTSTTFDGNTITAKCRAKVTLNLLLDDGSINEIQITAHHVPNVSCNVFSTTQGLDNGIGWVDHKNLIVNSVGTTIGHAYRNHNVPWLRLAKIRPVSTPATTHPLVGKSLDLPGDSPSPPRPRWPAKGEDQPEPAWRGR